MARDPWAQFKDAPTAPTPAVPAGADPFAAFQDADEAPDPMAGQPTTGLPRPLALAARSVVNAAMTIPSAAADFGVGIRNVIDNPRTLLGEPGRYESPSAMAQRQIDRTYGSPVTTGEKAVDLATTLAAGAAQPIPKAPGSLPANFKTAAQVTREAAAQRVKDAQAAGYVLPPATGNPTGAVRALEGVAGKLSTAQEASIRNQYATNSLAKRALGLDEALPIGDQLPVIRQQAGDAYKAVAGAGRLQADDAFRTKLADITSANRGAAADFPELAKTDLADEVAKIDKESFSADGALKAIKLLRDNATAAYGRGDKPMGKAYREMAGALEDVIERNLEARGKDAAGMLKAFRDARQLIAKTYSVENALNPATGNVSATKLGAQLDRGKPLSGELRQIAQTSKAFPKATREVNESMPGVSPLDYYASGGVSALSGQPTYLLYPFARAAVRSAILSRQGQKLAVPSTEAAKPATAKARALAAALAATGGGR